MNINIVQIKDKKMLYDQNFEPKPLLQGRDNWLDRGFMYELDSLENGDQDKDDKFFTKKIDSLGLFKKKYIEVLEKENSTLSIGRSQKSQGKRLILELIAKKIKRIENKIFSINFEIKFVEGKCEISFAPREWCLINKNCYKLPQELKESQKLPYLNELYKADEKFISHRHNLLNQQRFFESKL